MQKLASKCLVIIYTCFCHSTAKHKDITLKLSMRVACYHYIYHKFTHKQYRYRVFYISKIWNWWSFNFLAKIEILNFGDKNWNISKVRECHCAARSVFRLCVFFLCVAFHFETAHVWSLQTLVVFYPKWWNMTSLKRHLLKKKSEPIFWKFEGRRHIHAR